MSVAAPLTLSFDPRTIEHLGVRMYSHVPNAVAELVANAYDADATLVRVIIGSDRTITVEDDGHGMSREDVADKYLRIGRNRRRTEGSVMTEGGKRRVSGKKGLGKLALFGIGRVVEVTTTRKGSLTGTRITMSYQDLVDSEGDYRPRERSLVVDIAKHGTTVTLADLRRKIPINPEQLATSLSRLFNYTDEDFRLVVVDTKSNEIEATRDRRLESLDREFVWRFPDDFTDNDSFLVNHGIGGVIVSTAKPLRNVPRGITLYASGRMVNEPEFFGASESSHAYSYLTGHIDVDFVDVLGEDVIATDRRALVWDSSEMETLRHSLAELLTRIGREWRTRRSEERRNRSQKRTGISIEHWTRSIKSDDARRAIEKILEYLSSDDLDLTADQEATLTENIHRLVPPYADYVWRRLHPEIQEASMEAYAGGVYHTAIVEGVKRYIAEVAEKAKLEEAAETNVLDGAFGRKGKLTVAGKYLGDARGLSKQTAANIEVGQRDLSSGLYSAFRNPISHEEIKTLQETGALTYEDCLDALSILSHLMRRLDGAELRHDPGDDGPPAAGRR